MEPKDRLFVALDFRRAEEAKQMAKRLQKVCRRFKTGSLLSPLVPEGVDHLAGHGEFFADCKWYDTPNTLRAIGISLIRDFTFIMCTVHARGGIHMMQALRNGVDEGVRQIRKKDGWHDEWRPKLIAVTCLTSEKSTERQILKLASDALKAGMDGITSPAWAVPALRKRFADKLVIVVPGVRFRGSKRDNHLRPATPFQAIRDGADYIVMGRPITEAANPVAATRRAVKEIAEALAKRM